LMVPLVVVIAGIALSGALRPVGAVSAHGSWGPLASSQLADVMAGKHARTEDTQKENTEKEPVDPRDASKRGKPEDTRVLLVKIAFQETTPLKLGQRVEVRIENP